MMPENIVKKKLKYGKTVVGSFVITAHPAISEVMARAGFDWLVFDMEHGVIGIESIEVMTQAISGTDTTPIVRVPWNDFVVIKQVLDTGVMGLIIPMVNNAEQAEMAVRATRYPPEGIRGIGPHRASGFGKWLDEYFEKSNENILVIVQIEHIDAVRNLESIISVKGIDAVFIGTNDLSASMGLIKDMKHPSIEENVQYILKTCKNASVPVGIIASQPEDIKKRINQGFQFIAVGHEISLLTSCCKNIISQIKTDGE
ncbi:MAG TPA: HpcH/HpaI aldolase/citrate lyase family protein [Candidatus Ratteibacteria bacterium]|uniref:5-keto-4-deoxy-D-glucarate aldolase n=1 Tax=candidate division TA06 bacterium ADurb.Bin131 TaxID=1852827 RepID=A0A1V6C4X2_UNCT6|nr:MAG: 5-keto-4-deoxy-D-glucarate aldolase [candidate division TA06 bacterium ADurb.Bin131]HOC02520.1 HpcH/HpaI aldolase/citrate lyase family protein [bacterium]HRS05722.1 HpcH/HpaI aldolase/citrate lyase family protein [Candidatus Ratteibacteria bacterium]HON04792.1 HpcH/HpaI aldolase/citrate lyase family protein [bacterium]HPC29248.1 HpcH/HpaI aldolase/citrate lyase family protein [bacterium]